MKRTVLSCLSICLLSAGALADQERQGSGFYVGIGGGVFSVRADNDDEEDFPTINNVHLQGGYKFSENFSIEGQYSVSAEKTNLISINQTYNLTNSVKQSLSDSFSAGQLADLNSVSVTAFGKAQVSFETMSIYAAYRTTGDLYAKVKIGAASTQAKLESIGRTSWDTSYASTASASLKSSVQALQQDFDKGFQQGFSSSTSDESERDTNFSVGVGGGYKLSEHLAAELEYTKLTEDIAYASLSINYSF